MKYKFLILFLLITITTFGQDNFRIEIKSGQVKDAPIMILKMNSNYFQLDNFSRNQINPKWIKKIEVLKREKDKNLFGNSNGIVLIYPKKRFKRKISVILANNETMIIDLFNN